MKQGIEQLPNLLKNIKLNETSKQKFITGKWHGCHFKNSDHIRKNVIITSERLDNIPWQERERERDQVNIKHSQFCYIKKNLQVGFTYCNWTLF